MATSSTSSSSIPGFNGTSTYASDLQTVITRAVSIASLPITQLQNQQSTFTSQQSALQTLGNDFQNLQTALSSLDSAASSGSLAPSVDNTTVASAAVSSGALAGTYSVNIASLGALTNSISNSNLPSVSDPTSGNISSSSTFTLSVNGSDYSLTPAANNLNSLVAAINASGANVQATIVNVGGSTSPSYQLSIQGTQYAPTTIQLNDGSQNLLSTLTSGSYVTYQVNGEPANSTATSTSRTLAISPGLTVTAKATGTANVTLAQNGSGVENGLSSLVTSFNTAVDDLAKNRGQSGGALSGDSIVQQLSGILQSVGNYSNSSGSVNSLTDLGLSFDQNGHLQFDASQFESTASTSLSSVTTFLGSASGNTGFLGAASQALESTTDATTGLITTATNSIGTSLNHLTTQITADQDRVTHLQASLTAQIAAADAAIASLQSQETQITNLFAAEAQASKNITG
jgi:flagellar hook-associated protein 2